MILNLLTTPITFSFNILFEDISWLLSLSALVNGFFLCVFWVILYLHVFSVILHNRNQLYSVYERRMPIFVKISPDMSDSELLDILKVLNDFKIDGIIATNTSTSRQNVSGLKLSNETGGLSGAPIKDISFKILEKINSYDFNNLEVISCGGIDSYTEAMRRFDNGAKLIQIYTGLIYEGPSLIMQCIKAYRRLTKTILIPKLHILSLSEILLMCVA